jgi:SNF family Na+-dependent transporter
MSDQKQGWGTRVGLILAMAGNAVGLGNFLRFPMEAIENGGGAFIIPYIICFLVMGIPLLWIEWTMGRFGGRFGNHSTPFILDNMTHKQFWKYFGVFGIFTNICVAAFYCYVEAWTLTYVVESLLGAFADMKPEQVALHFREYIDAGNGLSGIVSIPMLSYIVCLTINIYFLSRGLQGGIEKVARTAMPLLLIFGALLAIRGLTLGRPEGAATSMANCPDCDAFLALNFLWEPRLTSLGDPKVWLEAAGQIFFTLSAGMGTIHCYASYVRSRDDIALNAMSAGWMNGFVEMVLGAAVVIPIAGGYLGLDWIRQNAGFSMAFETMPYLFNQGGALLGALGGALWFGLLFISGITSSLAMGTPWLGFMYDEFNWGRVKSAISFGVIVFLMGLPTVLLYNQGVFDEYNFWTGTMALVVFATAETVLFAWIFGINRGWQELQKGADIKIPVIFKWLAATVTPVLLLILFMTSIIKPADSNWSGLLTGEAEFAENSIVGKVGHYGFNANLNYYADYYEADQAGVLSYRQARPLAQGGTGKDTMNIKADRMFYTTQYGNPLRVESEAAVPQDQRETIRDSMVVVKSYEFDPEEVKYLKEEGDPVAIGERFAEGGHWNRIFFVDISRIYLTLLWLGIAMMVWRATWYRKKTGRVDVYRED